MNTADIEKHLFSAIDKHPDCIFLMDIEGKILYINENGKKLIGIKNLGSTNLFSRLKINTAHSDSLSALKTSIKEKGRFKAKGELKNSKTGKKIIVRIEASASPMNANYILVKIMDISGENKLRQKAMESVRNYKYLINNAPLGILIVSEGKIIFLNPALINLLGYESENELIGKQVIELIHPDFHKKAKQRLKRLTTDIHRIVNIAEEKFIKKDGSAVDVIVMGQSIKYQGKKAIQGYIYDISDRKKTGDLLRESEIKFTTLIEGATDAIISIDHKGIINLWNKSAEKMFGYSKEEAIGKQVHNLITPESLREKATINLKRFLKDGQGKIIGSSVEVMGLHKSGSTIPIELSLTSLKTKNGWEATAFIRDISLRKKLESQLHQSQKMESIGRLTGGIAHDFNNILSVIIGYSEMMLYKLKENDPLHKITSTILDSANRAASLTSQLLAFSRKQIINPEKININHAIQNIKKILERVIGENIELKTYFGKNLPYIKIDKGQLDQIILNLAVNAKDAMPAGGSLTIETSVSPIDNIYFVNQQSDKHGEYVVITISDDGIGIPSDIKEKIFDPFFTTKEVGKGTGLGLSTVYGIVKQNNGFIWVYSEPNIGTSFKIYLPPILKEDDHKHEIKKSNIQGEEQGSILLVEDELNVRELIINMLKTTQYSIIETGDVDEALEIMQEKGDTIDLLMTDVIMPKLDGKSLSEQCRKINPNLKVLYMSGYTEDVIVNHGVLEEGIHFIQKPFTIQTMLNKINEIFTG